MDTSETSPTPPELPTLALPVADDWVAALAGPARVAWERILAGGIASRRWFGSKARSIRAVRIVETFRVTSTACVTLIEVEFDRGGAEVYQMPIALAVGDEAQPLLDERSPALWARVTRGDGPATAVLFDALVDPEFCRALLRLFNAEAVLPGDAGEMVARQTSEFGRLRGEAGATLAARLVASEQSNSSVVFGDRLILKLFRRVETGVNPDVELNDYLTRRGFTHVPPLAATLEYRHGTQEPWALAMLQGFVPNQGDAWQYLLTRLCDFLRDAQRSAAPTDVPRAEGAVLLAAGNQSIPPEISQALAPYLADAERLGVRTAELHLALAAERDDPSFAPEPLTHEAQQGISERASTMARETFELLRRQHSQLTREVGVRADAVLALEPKALDELTRIADEPIDVHRIRCHGDYHLGQVLAGDGDFMIIDFEGEPARPLAQRREKQLALRDVAGMIRSFHYASRSATAQAARSATTAERRALEDWASAWYFWTSTTFLSAYRRTAGDAVFVPRSLGQFALVLDACLLEKAVYELKYELNNRPDWVDLPLAALVDLLTD